jgi:hypothetical protein
MKWLVAGGLLVGVFLWSRWLAFKKDRSNPAIAVGFGAIVALAAALIAIALRFWGL